MKTILVVGATGQQGSGVVRALSGSGRYFCLALTRNPSTPKAKKIASLKNVQLVSADLADKSQLASVFDDAKRSETGPIWGVFVALAFPGLGADAKGEELQGKNIASVATEFGVQCYIYSSAIRYWTDAQHAPPPNNDRHAKASIEEFIQDTNLPWTIVRPGFFMENLSPGIIGRLTDATLRYAGGKVQFVAARDVGIVSCAIFDDPVKFDKKILDIASAGLSSEERNEAFIRATGRHIPSAPIFLISILYRWNSNVQQIVYELRSADQARAQDPNGHDANLKEAAECAKLTTYEEWVREHHSVVQENAHTNGVTLWGLISGRKAMPQH